MGLTVERVNKLNTLNITILVEESETEGYRFLSRLVNEYKDGTNTFSEPGEALFCVRNDAGEVVAIGGVNRSPFAGDTAVARLQRFYVLNNERRQGAGSLLLNEIVNHSQAHFKEITVRTESSQADAFYRSNGFEFDDSISDTTHLKKFNE